MRSLLIAFTLVSSAFAYPPMTEAEQEKYANGVAWCEVTRVDLLEAPRIELGLSSQMRRYTLKVTEVVKGDVAAGATFSLEFAHYELLSTEHIKIVQPEILVWEIGRRPELKIGQEYRVYLMKRGDQIAPLSGRWSMLTTRPIKNLYEKWVGRKEENDK
jgi:hypothetical protein